MRLINKKNSKLLADRAKKALTARERMKGLLGQDGLELGQALYISPCTSIHSFFMRFVFDAAFVDHDGLVLHTIRRMKAWRISKIVPRSAGVIELPAGVLEQTDTVRGDTIEFQEFDPDPEQAGD